MIPFGDLKRQYLSIKEEINNAIKEVLEKGWYVLGQELENFENKFAEYCGKKFCCGVGNGTQALELALKGSDLGPGDEVITVPNTSPFTVIAILNCGAKPVFIDCKEDYLIDVDKIESVITKKTKAIVPVHLYGQVCEMDIILDIAKRHNLYIIEDCCQAHGARYKGKIVPIGDIGCFSFYPSKNLGAFGDGGAIVSNNEKFIEKMRILRNGGQKIRDKVQFIGINSRLDEIQATILNAKLKYLEKWNRRRREIARLYNSLLKGVVRIPEEEHENRHVYHLYVIRTEKRDLLMNYLRDKNIDTGIHYPIALHLQEAYRFLGYKKGDFPNTEKYSREILSLPCFPELKDEEIEEVGKKIREFFED